MKAVIYQPAKTAMQSGKAKTKRWVLRLPAPESAREIDPLMGWTSHGDTKSQLRFHFETKEAAIAYANARQIGFELREPKTSKPKIRPYASNFTG